MRQELATLALFQYLIGNTDWSALYGHNTVALQDANETLNVVPYDFDFSGLVDLSYAVPAPELSIRTVRRRVFRGFCTPAPDWAVLFAAFEERQPAIMELTASIPVSPPRTGSAPQLTSGVSSKSSALPAAPPVSRQRAGEAEMATVSKPSRA